MPVDELAAQALEVQAEDMALEDTLYALQKAFQGGHLDATTYLRQVGLRTRIARMQSIEHRQDLVWSDVVCAWHSARKWLIR